MTKKKKHRFNPRRLARLYKTKDPFIHPKPTFLEKVLNISWYSEGIAGAWGVGKELVKWVGELND